MSDDATTDRAQRQQAVASGDAPHAVDTLDARSPDAGLTPGTPRSRQRAQQREIAAETDTDPAGVAVRDTTGGMDAFLRSTGVSDFAASLRSEFASAAEYVRERDVTAQVDPQQISADPMVAPGRRDDVADRAESEAASDTEFVTAADLDADVGAQGVTGLGIPEPRRDDVAARTRQGLAADAPFAEPADFEADVSAQGVESAGLTDRGERRRAARKFEADTPLSDVDPSADVTETGDGLALDDRAQRRVAARSFEADSDLFDTGELDPQTDLRATGDGFGLARDEAREVAAADLSEQLDTGVSPSAVELEARDDGGFRAIFEQGGGR